MAENKMHHLLLAPTMTSFLSRKRKYKSDNKTQKDQEGCVMFGFTSLSVHCFLCGEIQSNSAIKPWHLKCCLIAKHPLCGCKEDAELLSREIGEGKIKAVVQMLTSFLKASYQVSFFVAKDKKALVDY